MEEKIKITLNYEELKSEFKKVCHYLFVNKLDKDKVTKLNNLCDCVYNYEGECKNRWGSCDESIELMSYIRQLLCELNYIEQLNEDASNNWTKERSFGDVFFELFFNSNTVSKKMKDDYIKKDKSYKYDFDGWDYPNNKSHYYYNELDHYLTNMVRCIIKKNKKTMYRKFENGKPADNRPWDPGLSEIRLKILTQIN